MAGNNSSSSVVAFSTTLLYGVFATEKSFLTGIRSLERSEHASMVLNKAVDGRLPRELVDLILEQVIELDKPVVQAKWKSALPIDFNRSNFKSTGRGMAHEVTAEKRITSLGVRVIQIHHHKPKSHPAPQQSRQIHYVHLSATKRPTVSLSLPSTTLNYPTGVHHTGSKGSTCTILEANDDAKTTANEDLTYYSRKPSSSGDGETLGDPLQMAKIVECEHVEVAIREWDSEAVAKLVKLLDLKLIPFDERDPMKPGLHLWQRLHDL